MIRKLFYYDIKKMTKILKWFYLISIAFAVITRLINIGKEIQAIHIIGQVFAGFTYSAIANILINTFIHILRVFLYDFYRDESYLTHTLPVSKNKLFISKCLAGLAVVLSSVIVCVLTLFIMLYSKDVMLTVKSLISVAVSGLNMSSGAFIAILIVIILAQITAMMSMAYTAIVKANTYNRNRGFKGVAWFIAYYFGSTIVTLIIAVIVFAIGGNLSELVAEVMSASSFMTVMILALVLYPVYTFIHVLLCKWLFNKGVNVD
ncbi:MAG: hypothetical protein IJA97_01650 [Clostridia bacterium]|nr:hypothetical protein [Clostridia bacterium]